MSNWIRGRPHSDDKSLAEDIAVKWFGPVPGSEGERIIGVLQEQLAAAGVTVIQSATAYD